MRILFDIGHPAHVHLFKNIIKKLESDGNHVKITAREKDITIKLLNYYKIPFEIRGGTQDSIFKKALSLAGTDLRIYRIAKKFQPDILVGVHNPYIAHVGRLLNRPSVIFNDTENVKIARKLTYPVATVICTPSCFMEEVDIKKHVQINGYKELAYLHPNNFTPERSVLNDLGIEYGDKYIIVRFISWEASHDTGLNGIKEKSKKDFLKNLENYGRVFVSSERELTEDLKKYQITIPPEKMHSALYYASLYIGEGGTMAAEAAILGTPSIHIESAANGAPTGNLSGNFQELRNKYNLMYFFASENEAFEKAVEILENENSKKQWSDKKEILLNEKTDVAKWFSDFLERYPNSFYEYMRKV